MAKRKGLRTPKHDSLMHEQDQTTGFTAARLIHPAPSNSKRGVARAHAKHQNDNAIQGPVPHSLADRFHALPAEIRAEVFSLLLVQPVKWKLDHRSDCPLLTDPTKDIRPESCMCASCGVSGGHTGWRSRYAGWRQNTTRFGGWGGSWQSPWRSKYAPKVTNDFMCSDCWDERFREEVMGVKFPRRNRDMPCLCARRTDLDVLLVCRRWYDEASRILWAKNTFAFETCELFTSFASTCTARNKMTKISILNTGRHHQPDPYGEFEWPGWSYHKQRKALIASLRQFPALTHLELDSSLLRDAREVQAMLRLGMRNLRSVRFIYHPEVKVLLRATFGPVNKPGKIFPGLQHCVLLRGGLAEEVARAIKGEHRGWTKHHEAAKIRSTGRGKASKRQKPGISLLKQAVERYVAFEDELKTKVIPAHGIVNCDDEEVWARLWWKTGGRLHWSQSFLSVGVEQYEPKDWMRTVREKEALEQWEAKKKADWEWTEVFPFVELKL